MRCDLLNLDQGSLDLAREDVDAANDQHIVNTALEAGNARAGSAAYAGSVVDAGQVLGAVTDQRDAFLGQGSERKLAGYTVGHRHQRVGAQNLGIEMVLADVQALMELTVAGNARAHDFAQTVDVVSLDSQLALDFVAHLLGPGLCTADGGLKLDLVEQTFVLQYFGDVQQVGRRAGDCSCAEVDHHGGQLLGVTGAHRHNRRTDLLGTAVCA